MCSSLTRGASNNVKEYLCIEEDEDPVTCALTDSVALSEKIRVLFETDFTTVRMKGPSRACGRHAAKGGSTDSSTRLSAEVIYDEFGTRWEKSLYDYVPVGFALEHATVSDLEKFPWPDPYDYGRVAGVRDEARKLHQESSFAVVTDFICGGPFEQAQRIRGFQQFMVDLAVDQRFARALLDRLTDNAIGFWDAMLAQVGEYVDVVCQGDDLGMQTGLQISPEMYRKFVKPCHRRLFDFIHEKTEAQLWLHTCGSVYEIIPDLIELGVNALNPVQTGAKRMELWRLKKDFGRDITFWGGGIDIQKLPAMTIEEVKREVSSALEIMAPGGGYVFAATHNILPDTSGENIYTVYTTAVQNR
jgi:uroporphyrinogen decarboxylase